MSLLSDAFTMCVFCEKLRVPDGYGGTKTTWTEGAPFQAAITLDTSLQARVAAQQGVTALYTVTTRKELTLEYHDVFKRESDGKIFRITSDGDDKHTPSSAGLNMRQVSAEEWTLTS